MEELFKHLHLILNSLRDGQMKPEAIALEASMNISWHSSEILGEVRRELRLLLEHRDLRPAIRVQVGEALTIARLLELRS